MLVSGFVVCFVTEDEIVFIVVWVVVGIVPDSSSLNSSLKRFRLMPGASFPPVTESTNESNNVCSLVDFGSWGGGITGIRFIFVLCFL